MDLNEMVARLNEKRDQYKSMGKEKYINKQHENGKLTARERIDLLLDENSFTEMGLLAHHQNLHPTMKDKYTPADGVVVGHGKVDNRPVCIIAHDFTVLAGSTGKVAERKMQRAREWALKHRCPMIWLVDSAGVRIQESIGSLFAENGRHFFEEVMMSGVVPLICAVMGPGVAGTAYLPALADFVPMVKGTSFMALGGPHLVRSVVGEDVDNESLGGSKVHTTESGVADIEMENDEECIQVIKDYLSYFPSNCEEKPPVKNQAEFDARMSDNLLNIIPTNPKRGYDMYKVITELVDGGQYLPMKPEWAKNIITAFGRIGGIPVGIVANQPMHLGGSLDSDAADKAARFINICDSYSIPLLFLQDIPGFLVGSKVEKQGIIRHGAKMLHAVSKATVPKVTVVVRKAYGAGYFVMCGKQYDPDLVVAWPTAEISVMGAEGASSILYHKQINAADDPKSEWGERSEQFKELIDVNIAASNGLVDDIIDPRETRKVVYNGLELSWNKKVERPWRKDSIRPV